MDLAFNNQRLICQKTKPNQTASKFNFSFSMVYIAFSMVYIALV